MQHSATPPGLLHAIDVPYRDPITRKIVNEGDSLLLDPTDPRKDEFQLSTAPDVGKEFDSKSFNEQYKRRIVDAIKAKVESKSAATPEKGGELGGVSAKYESGGAGAGTISTGVSDPGGVSYGTHQLSSKAGTLDSYINKSKYGQAFLLYWIVACYRCTL